MHVLAFSDKPLPTLSPPQNFIPSFSDCGHSKIEKELGKVNMKKISLVSNLMIFSLRVLCETILHKAL
jgi:hypothetical protein